MFSNLINGASFLCQPHEVTEGIKWDDFYVRISKIWAIGNCWTLLFSWDNHKWITWEMHALEMWAFSLCLFIKWQTRENKDSQWERTIETALSKRRLKEGFDYWLQVCKGLPWRQNKRTILFHKIESRLMGEKKTEEEEERSGGGTGKGRARETGVWSCSRSGWTTASCMLHKELNSRFMNELLLWTTPTIFAEGFSVLLFIESLNNSFFFFLDKLILKL